MEQIALSFDGQASPSIGLLGEREDQPNLLPSAWGLAWYPDNQRAVATLRDRDVPRGTSLSLYLEDSIQFRSSLFLGCARGLNRPSTSSLSQPFVRSYAGRQWVLSCAGELSPDLKSELELGEESFDVAPVGNAPAEHALSWLLAEFRDRSARTIDEFGWRETHRLLQRLNQYGGISLLLSDGHDLVAYRDASDVVSFHWARLVPPHAETQVEGRSFSIDLDTPMDASRTLFAFSTLPMRGARWTPMESGEMRIARRGSCVWSSHPAGMEEHIFSHIGNPLRRPDPVAGDGFGVQTQQQRSVVAAVSEPPPAGESVAGTGGEVLLEQGAPESISLESNRRGPAAEEAILSVVHSTTYRYAHAVERSSHRFCLSPVHDDQQVVLDQSLEISVDGHTRDFEDVFGNRARVLEVHSPFKEMTITSQARCRVRGVSASQLKWPYQRDQIPLVWMPWQRQMMQAYLLPPELPEPQLRELSEFGMSFVERNDHDLVETLLDLNRTIYRDFEYVPGSTTVETTPFAVYRGRKGVCQDFANILICVARLLGVPARYRVGYIYTGGSYENKIQSDASHAWAELYLPLTGWFGFDPTNGCLAGSDHLRVACGRQFGDAAPTAGTIYRGGGSETLEVDVRVERLEIDADA